MYMYGNNLYFQIPIILSQISRKTPTPKTQNAAQYTFIYSLYLSLLIYFFYSHRLKSLSTLVFSPLSFCLYFSLMGCNHNITNNTSTPLTLSHFTISFLFILIISTSTQLNFTVAAGRSLGNPHDHSSQEEKMFLRGQIGSRPPRCEMKCSSCGQCEAIQVPTNPQVYGRSRTMSSNNALMYTIAYSRSEDNSNYKPMSWKCKCSKFFFNP